MNTHEWTTVYYLSAAWTSVLCPLLPLLRLCQTHKDSSAWLLLPVLAMINVLFPPPLWQNRAADSLVTLCKYIYFFLNISIYSIYGISLYSIYTFGRVWKHSGTFTWPCYVFFFFIRKINTDNVSRATCHYVMASQPRNKTFSIPKIKRSKQNKFSMLVLKVPTTSINILKDLCINL